MAKQPVGRPRKTPVFNSPRRSSEPAYIQDREPEPDFSLISEDRKAELRRQAAEDVRVNEEARAQKAFLEAEKERIERENHPEVFEEMKEILIDNELYGDPIIIDGKHYIHGHRYTVKKSLYDCLMDLMWRAHKHVKERDRNPMEVMREMNKSITKEGASFAVLNASTGTVQRF